METLWILLLALITQETLFSHVAITMAKSQGIPWVYINTIWLTVTAFHLGIPYIVGRALARRIKNPAFWKYIGRLEKHFSLEKKGSGFLYFVLGIFNFVYINSFLLAFLKSRSNLPFVFIFLGDLLWYILVATSTIFGVNILNNIQSLFFAVLVVVAFGVLGKEIIKKISR